MASKGGSDWTSDLNPFSGCNTGCTVFVLVASLFMGVIIAIVSKI